MDNFYCDVESLDATSCRFTVSHSRAFLTSVHVRSVDFNRWDSISRRQSLSFLLLLQMLSKFETVTPRAKPKKYHSELAFFTSLYTVYRSSGNNLSARMHISKQDCHYFGESSLLRYLRESLSNLANFWLPGCSSLSSSPLLDLFWGLLGLGGESAMHGNSIRDVRFCYKGKPEVWSPYN